MKQFIVVALWVTIAMVHGKEIIRGESQDLEERLKDLTEFEDSLVENRGDCSVGAHKVGCYVDVSGDKKKLTELLFTDRNARSSKFSGTLINWKAWDSYLKNFECRCAQATQAKGWTYFTTRFYGECWGGPTAVNPYSTNQYNAGCTSNGYQECNPDNNLPCVGKGGHNFLYHLNEGSSGGGEIAAYDV